MRTELVPLVGFGVLALGSMVVYRLRPGAEARRAALAHRGSFALGGWLRAWFYWWIGPLERWVVRAGWPPEVFNAGGIVLGVAAMLAYATGGLALAGWLVLLGGLCDVFDGVVARARGIASDFGAFLDSTLDRFHEALVFLGIAAFAPTRFGMLLVVAALAGSLLVSYTRARGESLGVTCKHGILQRAERLLLLGFGSILDPWISARLGRPPGDVVLGIVGIIALGTAGTAIYRTVWISRALRASPGPPKA